MHTQKVTSFRHQMPLWLIVCLLQGRWIDEAIPSFALQRTPVQRALSAELLHGTAGSLIQCRFSHLRGIYFNMHSTRSKSAKWYYSASLCATFKVKSYPQQNPPSEYQHRYICFALRYQLLLSFCAGVYLFLCEVVQLISHCNCLECEAWSSSPPCWFKSSVVSVHIAHRKCTLATSGVC